MTIGGLNGVLLEGDFLAMNDISIEDVDHVAVAVTFSLKCRYC